MTNQIFSISIFLVGLNACKETPLQRADNDFDVSVSAPTFKSTKPIILFDEGHNNFHTTEGLYKPFANLVKNDGYNLKTLDQLPDLPAVKDLDQLEAALSQLANMASATVESAPPEATLH